MSAAGDGGMSPAVCVKKEWIEVEIEFEEAGSEQAETRELAPGPEDDACASRISESLNKTDRVAVKQELEVEYGPEAELPGEAPGRGNSCEEQYLFKTCFVKFERISVDEEQHACTTCHRTFEQKASLMSHRCISSEEASCSNIVKSKKVIGHPNRQLTDRAKLGKNKLIRTGKTPYSCEICQKQFTRGSTLASHRLIHTGEKPYSCKICKKQFAQRSNLASHRLIHTGEKPYTCEICKKQFARRSNLASHRLIHTGEKPYSCKICNKQLMRSNSLASHMLIHTGEDLHPCETCKKQFTLRSSLARHIQLFHSEKSE